MPPSQWVRLRQNNRPLGMISTSRITEAPAVVKPETDSKIASTGELKIPLQKNGRAPNTPTANHPRVVMAMPSRWVMGDAARVRL